MKEPEKKCPYLEVVTMTFCSAYPIKKLVPLESMKDSSPCLTENGKGCSLYTNNLHNALIENVRGFQLERWLYYSYAHLWLRPEGDNIRMGVDDFSKRLLGSISGITLPLIGTIVKEGDILVTLRCGPRHAELPSPLSGEVVDIHDGLLTHPEALNADPYGWGWMLLIRPLRENPLKEMLWGKNARTWFEEDIERLHRILEAEVGVAATDGGEPVPDLHTRLDEVQWNRLIRLFFAGGKED